jgi:hypothetical protein
MIDDDESWLTDDETTSESPPTETASGARHPDSIQSANSQSTPETVTDPPAELRFASVYDFVEQHLIFIYARDVNNPARQWCKQWWAHCEAVSRLEALWRAYEHLRLDPGTGMDVWWLDHADRQMAVLLSPDGPFDGCSAELGRHTPTCEMLPIERMEEDVLRQIMSGQLTEGN